MADRPRDVTILAPAGFLIAIAQLAIGIFMILFVGVTLDSSTIFTIGSVLLVVSGAARLFGYWGVWNLRRTGWELAVIFEVVSLITTFIALGFLNPLTIGLLVWLLVRRKVFR